MPTRSYHDQITIIEKIDYGVYKYHAYGKILVYIQKFALKYGKDDGHDEYYWEV